MTVTRTTLLAWLLLPTLAAAGTTGSGTPEIHVTLGATLPSWTHQNRTPFEAGTSERYEAEGRVGFALDVSGQRSLPGGFATRFGLRLEHLKGRWSQEGLLQLDYPETGTGRGALASSFRLTQVSLPILLVVPLNDPSLDESLVFLIGGSVTREIAQKERFTLRAFAGEDQVETQGTRFVDPRLGARLEMGLEAGLGRGPQRMTLGVMLSHDLIDRAMEQDRGAGLGRTWGYRGLRFTTLAFRLGKRW